MKQFTTILTFASILCAGSANAAIASISKSGTNIVLSWPSTPGQAFLVQHRASLDPGVAWVTLTNMDASIGTNRTSYTVTE